MVRSKNLGYGRFLRTGALLLVAALLFSSATVLAATTSKSTSSSPVTQSVTQAYGSDTALQKGMIVKLKPGDNKKVVPLDQEHDGDMLGIVVAANDSAVSLSSDSNYTHQVYVASTGRFEVLVSNQNGPLKIGDYITVSSVDGIGMKAGSDGSIVLGKTDTAFDGTGKVEGSASLTDTKGGKKNINIGRVSLTITVAHNPLQRSADSTFPGIFQKIGAGVANKPVSPARAYLSMALLLISAVVTTSILFGGVRSGIISIGRNPLAKKSIVRSMIQVIITGLIVFIIGLFGVYLLLRL
ncbi:MAG: hypothetical protein ABIR37_03750 [Candidatus Saccharimonadales bacterium]